MLDLSTFSSAVTLSAMLIKKCSLNVSKSNSELHTSETDKTLKTKFVKDKKCIKYEKKSDLENITHVTHINMCNNDQL